ncbi:Protein of unknown function DUF4246 [Penicillium concentricum]|uniref:Uncharacterized protein n=1 Tax=Penicillium concentricum TaxID=293559 RepID=A0A9W9RSP3_9EURO|nr:Protein of unknown function DUF4246 [Penicillium concentricum]KAJ5365626.1 Protein of unknown function DUF4246 [Penicillium concentricum]
MQEPQLFVREASMLQFMSYVTEQPGWENKCEDPQTLEEWHQHADSVFELDEPSWQWCVRELRDKASDFKRTGYVAVFDANLRVIKSQVSGDLLRELRESMSLLFSKLGSDSSSTSADAPGGDSESPVRHVVDPFMYPLVYGRTPVLTDGGKVDVERPESWRSSQSQIAPIPKNHSTEKKRCISKREKKKAKLIAGVVESIDTGRLPFNAFLVKLLLTSKEDLKFPLMSVVGIQRKGVYTKRSKGSFRLPCSRGMKCLSLGTKIGHQFESGLMTSKSKVRMIGPRCIVACKTQGRDGYPSQMKNGLVLYRELENILVSLIPRGNPAYGLTLGTMTLSPVWSHGSGVLPKNWKNQSSPNGVGCIP